MQPGEQNDILIYQADDGRTRLEVHLDHETVWLSQRQIANLFDVKVPAISKHVRNIFDSGELAAEATVSKMERVRREGARMVSGTEVHGPRGVGPREVVGNKGKIAIFCIKKAI